MGIIFFKSRCYNGGDKHKFLPRYTEKQITHKSIHAKKAILTIEQIKALTCYKEYLFDICEWCGKKIK